MKINGKYVYRNIDHKQYSKEKLKKYLYKQGSSLMAQILLQHPG